MPSFLPISLAVALLLQISFQALRPKTDATMQPLADPPGEYALRLASLDEPEAVSRVMMLYLQAFDLQPGVIVPYRRLDYPEVVKWLQESLDLDPSDPYPLFAACYLYGGVNDSARLRTMLDFIYRSFLENPDQRWRWLAQGTLIAKYQLHDLSLALRYSEALAKYATGKEVPHWVTQMSVFTLEELGRVKSAKILLGGLLASGKIKDANERQFLSKALKRMEKEDFKIPLQNGEDGLL